MTQFTGRLFAGRLFAGRLFRAPVEPFVPTAPTTGGPALGGSGARRREQERIRRLRDDEDVLLFLLR